MNSDLTCPPCRLRLPVLALGVALTAPMFLAGASARADDGGKNAPAAVDPILAWAPPDTQALLYVGDTNAAMAEPLTQIVMSAASEPLRAAHASWQETFAGPLLIAVRGSGFSLMSLGVTIATRDAGGDVPLTNRIEERLVPALGRLMPDRAELSVGRDGRMITITPFGLPMPPMTLYVAARDGVVLGDTSRSKVVDFVNGNAPATGFMASADVQRLTDIERMRAGQVEQLAYLNVRPLIAMARGPMDSVIPGLFEGLGLGSLEFVAFHTQADGELLRERTFIGVADLEALSAQLLASKNGDLDLIESLPADWPMTWTRAWDSAEWIVDIAEHVAGPVDQDIVTEYREELGEFAREVGFDPQREFLGNLVGQVGGGFYLEHAGEHDALEPRFAIVFAVRDPQLLHYQLQNLIDAFGLEIRTQTHQGVAITSRADGGRPHLAYAVADGQWILSTREAAIVEILDARKQQRTNAQDAEASRILAKLSAPAGLHALFRPEQVVQLLLPKIDESMDELGDVNRSELTRLREFIANMKEPMATGVAAGPGLVTIERLMDRSLPSLPAQVALAVAPSIARSRELSKRLVSAANIRGIMTACQIYANEQETAAYPESLRQMVELGQFSLKQLQSPYDGSGPASMDQIEAKSAYLYLPGINANTEGDLSSMVIVAERSLRDGGGNFGFADGHVEWINNPEASRLLAELKQSIRSNRRD